MCNNKGLFSVWQVESEDHGEGDRSEGGCEGRLRRDTRTHPGTFYFWSSYKGDGGSWIFLGEKGWLVPGVAYYCIIFI